MFSRVFYSSLPLSVNRNTKNTIEILQQRCLSSFAAKSDMQKNLIQSLQTHDHHEHRHATHQHSHHCGCESGATSPSASALSTASTSTAAVGNLSSAGSVSSYTSSSLPSFRSTGTSSSFSSFSASSASASASPSRSSNSNRGVAYVGPSKVSVQKIPFPTLTHPDGKDAHDGVILRVLASCICGSDQHMVRSRTTAPSGLILGHEITGEVIESGIDVKFLKKGDIVSVPFNVACGRCRNCREGKTGICSTVNPARAGGAYGYVDMGGWIGGQAEFVMIPYADFNCLPLPKKPDLVKEKILDYALLADIFPTGFHAAKSAGVDVGSVVYIAGAGPVGLAAAASCKLLGAACVIVGDLIPERLSQARKMGCETIDVSKVSAEDMPQKLFELLGTPEVDAVLDAVGYESRGCGQSGHRVEQPATIINLAMQITRAGGAISLPGLYVTEDPKGVDAAAKVGSLSLRLGLGWAKSHTIFTGQTPVLKYNRQLMNAITYGKVEIAKAVNAQKVSLDDAPNAYKEFDSGKSVKFVIDPHNQIKTK